MVHAAWSLFMPLATAGMAAMLVSKHLFKDRHVIKAIMRANEVVMSEKELELVRERKSIKFLIKLINRLDKIFNLKLVFLDNINNMLLLMGENVQAEKEVAIYIFNGLLGALPLLLVSAVTGVEIYTVLYPLGVFLLVYRQYKSLQKRFKKWQLELVKDLPELIDKLRISFAGGRDYISALIQAKEGSGPRMRAIIERLINDLQYMRYSQALDNFSNSLRIPAATKFAAALKISVEYGYQEAENYFRIIESDIVEVRRTAIEELTKSKPEMVYQLYLILIALAVGSLAVKAWEIFSLVNKIM